MTHGTITALPVDVQMAEATVASLRRLQSAFVALSTALKETLHGKRSDAAESLRRAEAMLDVQHGLAMRGPAEVRRQGLAPWQVRRVLAYIDANLDTSLKNKDLAAIAHLSPFHFNVAFRNSVGASPHEYIIRRRMERAQGLMLSTEKPLSENAAECGLADQAHLTRLFHRIVGESPAAWRRARANPNP
jgi:AraC-like DNA-binding protein